MLPPLPHGTNDIAIYPPHGRAGSVIKGSIYIFSILYLSTDYQKFSSDYSHSVVGGTSSARGMRSASELRDLMDTLQRKKIALENSLRANGNANPSYFSVTQVGHVVTRFQYLLFCSLSTIKRNSLITELMNACGD